MSSDKLSRSTKALRVNSIDQDKFRSSLNLMEQDRHHLLQSLREVQKKNELEAEKNFELGRNLNFQSEHIKNLESENEDLTAKLKTLSNRLEEIENLYNSLVQERGSLRVTVSQLQDELQINKLQASDKELYIEKLASSYNDEKNIILNVHQKHSKVLTVKILFEAVASIYSDRTSWALSKMKERIMINVTLAKMTFMMMKRFVRSRTRFALDELRRNVRTVKVEKIVKAFVTRNRSLATKKKVWKVLNSMAKDRMRAKERVRKGIFKTSALEKSRTKVRMLRLVTRWKNVMIKDLYGKRVLASAVHKKHLQALLVYFRQWIKVKNSLKQLQAYEDLSCDLSAFSFKQAVFYEFKRICQIQAQRKKFSLFVVRLQVQKNKHKVLVELGRFKALQGQRKTRLQHFCDYFSNKSTKLACRKWRNCVAQHHKSKNLSTVFKNHLKHSSFLGVNKLFISWKLFTSQNKLSKTHKALQTEGPLRQKFEQGFNELLSHNSRIMMTKVIQNMMKSGKSILRSYWLTWTSIVYKFNLSKRNLAKRLLSIYSQFTLKAFSTWKDFVRRSHFCQLSSSQQETSLENQVLLEHISNLEACLQGTTEAKKAVSTSNFVQVLKTIEQKTKISNLRKWGQIAFKSSNYLSGALRLNSCLYFNVLLDGFESLQLFNRKKYVKEVHSKKLYIFTFKKWKKFNSFMVQGWVSFVRLQKFHRARMTKVLTCRYRRSLALAVECWRDWLHFLNRSEGEVRLEVLENQLNQVREELEDVCQCLSVEKERTWSLEEILRYKNVRRLVLSLEGVHIRTLNESIFRWTGFVTKERLKFRYLNKMIHCNKRIDVKAAVQTWIDSKNLMIKIKSNSNYSNLLNEKKVMRREMNSLKSALESQLDEKQGKLEKQLEDNQKLSKRLDKMLQISIRKQAETLTVPLSHQAFRSWKLFYSAKKSNLSNLIRITAKAKQRTGFHSIFLYHQRIVRQSHLHQTYNNFFYSFRSRKLKHAFNKLVHRSYRSVQGSQSKELQVYNNKISALAIKLHKSKQSSLSKALKFVWDKNRIDILRSWKETTRKLKAIKDAHERFESRANALKAKFSVNQWTFCTQVKLRNKQIQRLMLQSRLGKVTKVTFDSWKNLHLTGRSVERSLKLVKFHFSRELLNFAFSSVKAFAVHQRTFSTWHQFHKSQSTKVALSIFAKQDLFHNFQCWRSKSRHLSSILSKISHVLSSSKARLERHGLQLWSLKVSLIQTALHIESHGKTARSLSKLVKVHQTMQRFIKSEGLSSRYFDEYQMQHLSSDLYFWYHSFDRSDTLQYRFTVWKMFVIKRQSVKFLAFRMNAYRYKGNVVHCFGVWKGKTFSDSLTGMNRRGLIRSLVVLERENREIKESLKEKHVNLKYLESYTDILEEHVRRGQNQALARCAVQVHRVMNKFLTRWMANVHITRIVINELNLRELEDELMYTRRKCRDYDIENKELVVENKGLLTALMKAEDIIMKANRLN